MPKNLICFERDNTRKLIKKLLIDSQDHDFEVPNEESLILKFKDYLSELISENLDCLEEIYLYFEMIKMFLGLTDKCFQEHIKEFLRQELNLYVDKLEKENPAS